MSLSHRWRRTSGDDTNGSQDVFVHDRQTGLTTRVSVDTPVDRAMQLSRVPTISADGTYVAFYSAASNLVTGDTNGTMDVFVHDRQTGRDHPGGVRRRASQGINGGSYWPTVTADGRFIAFPSRRLEPGFVRHEQRL